MFTSSIGHLKKVGNDGLLCAKYIGLAQMEQLPALKVLAALRD
jgi:hypothetical protein